MQQVCKRQEYLLAVYNTVIDEDRKSDMEEHRKYTFQHVHCHQGIVKCRCGLHGRKRYGGGLFRNVQGFQRSRRITFLLLPGADCLLPPTPICRVSFA